MDLIIDANILFAALIKKDLTSDLIVYDFFRLYAPEYIFTEFEKYRGYIKRKTERSNEDFNEALNIFRRRIELIPYEEIKPFINKAREISPDIKDIPYIALALKLNIPIWSNDKTLKEKQNKIKIYSTHELISM